MIPGSTAFSSSHGEVDSGMTEDEAISNRKTGRREDRKLEEPQMVIGLHTGPQSFRCGSDRDLHSRQL